MKKIRWTMFKKMFLVLIVSFLSVNIITMGMDYTSEKRNIIEIQDNALEMNNTAGYISKIYSEKGYTLNDSEFQKVLNEYSDVSDFNTWFKYIVVDKDYQVVNKTDNKEHSISFQYDRDATTSISRSWLLPEFNIRDDGKELEEAIKKQISEGKDIVANYTNINDEFTYLEIAGVVLIDSEQKQDIKTTLLHRFRNHNVEFEYDPHTEESSFIDYEEIFDQIVSEVKKHELVLQEKSSNLKYRGIYEKHFLVEDNKDLYSCKVVPLLKKGVEYSLDTRYSLDDFDGYLIMYNAKLGVFTSLLEDIFYDNSLIIFMSLLLTIIVCIIVAYSFTRRIVNIEKATQKISDNDYDIHLKVDTSDEIGSLSHNINIMSEKIKNTIIERDEEIDRVKKLESMKSEFITNFTHEIKTPISIINGYIELIDQSDDESKKKEYIDAINKETDRINDLVLSMLNLTRLQSHNVQLNIEEIELDDLIISIIDNLNSLIQKKNIEVIVDSDSSKILGDYKELSTVINNFMTNAIKHTNNEGRITIKVKESSFSIENEGHHIDEKDIEHIWDTYVSSDREGTGLGLAINKAILDLHGYQYGVTNKQDGVEFYFKEID